MSTCASNRLNDMPDVTPEEWAEHVTGFEQVPQLVEELVKAMDDTNPKDRIGDTKPQLHLIPPSALVYCARVMELGAAKYGEYNWRSKRVRRTVYLSAAMRHLLADLDGEEIDPESGVPHLAHVMACMAIVLDALATGNLIDDRPPHGDAARLIREATKRSDRA